MKPVIEQMTEQIAGKCIHFNGMINDKCGKGIAYNDVKDKSARPYKIPCLKKEVHNGGSCEHCQFPSEEEAFRQANLIEEKQTKTIGTLIAVKQHYAKTKKSSGVIECLGCGGELHYLVASNGHTRASCEDCEMGWVE